MSIDPRRVIEDPKISYRAADGWIDAFTGTTTPVGWPTADNTGIAQFPGWVPAFTLTDDVLDVFEEGAVIEDFEFINTTVNVRAPNVTIRRCNMVNGAIVNEYGGTIYNHMTVEDTTIRSDPPGKWMATIFNTAILTAGFTCRRVAIIDTNEGIHTGGSLLPLADPDHPLGRTVRLYNCYTDIVSPVSSTTGIYCQYDADAAAADPTSPAVGDWIDWHGDTVQAEDGGEGGVPLIARNCRNGSRDLQNDDAFPCGASAIWYTRPLMSAPPDVDGLIVSGAGFTIHNGCGGKWRNVHIIQDSWTYGPTSFERWDNVTLWEDVFVSTLDGDGNPVPVARIPYGYPGYGPLDPL